MVLQVPLAFFEIFPIVWPPVACSTNDLCSAKLQYVRAYLRQADHGSSYLAERILGDADTNYNTVVSTLFSVIPI